MNKAIDTEYRVIRLPEPLRKSIKVARDAADQTNQEFVASVVDKHLTKLVGQLQMLGFTSIRGKLHPTRLPFSVQEGTLQVLAEASNSTGIPMVHLLQICLTNEVSGKNRRRKR